METAYRQEVFYVDDLIEGSCWWTPIIV